MNFSIVSCVAYFVIFYIYLNVGKSAVQPASKFYSSYVNSSLVYIRLMQGGIVYHSPANEWIYKGTKIF